MENASYKKLLDSIYDVEGGRLHRNPKEKDITNAYGIYRFQQPKAAIWTYIDSIAKTITTKPSSLWDDKTIEAIDAKIDKVKERELSYEFYKEFFVGAYLELFHPDLVIMVANCYVNTPLGTIKAIQEALNDCYKYGIFKVDKKEVPPVLGKFGPQTRTAVTTFSKNADWKDIIIFKNCALLYMKSYYAELVIGNTITMLPNLRGWNNRMENAQHI